MLERKANKRILFYNILDTFKYIQLYIYAVIHLHNTHFLQIILFAFYCLFPEYRGNIPNNNKNKSKDMG